MGAIRMNVTLPEDVVRILKKKTKSGEKSAYIAEAIRFYSKKETQEELIKKMIEGYKASHDLSSEDQTWLNADLSGEEDEY